MDYKIVNKVMNWLIGILLVGIIIGGCWLSVRYLWGGDWRCLIAECRIIKGEL